MSTAHPEHQTVQHGSAEHDAEAPEAFSQRLRTVSFSGHGSSEDWTGTPESEPAEPQYATAFLRGGLNRDGIAAQVAQHYLMYEALEAATAAQRELRGSDFPFWMPELHRTADLEADLQYWLGDDWEEAVRGRYATPGIIQYVDRINEVARDSYPHYIAHHYTRYLADLSGGQMIAKMFRRSYDMDGLDGTRFYTFAEIDDPRAYKNDYRALLDDLGLTEEEQEAVVDEVAHAYRLNNIAGSDLEARFEEYRA